MLKSVIRCFSVIAVNVFIVCSGMLNAGFGDSGWIILRKVESAQSKAITSVAPIAGNISGFLYNPAVLGMLKMPEVSLISELGPVGDRLGSILYGIPVKNGTLAGGFVYYDAGKADLNWFENGQLMSRSVSAQRDIMGIVAIEKRMTDKMSVGVSIKGVGSELAQTSTAYACASDVGLAFRPFKNISLSAAIQNLGGATEFIDKITPLPVSGYFGGGFALRLKDAYIVCAGGATYYKEEKELIPDAGFEIGYGFISFNGGYRFSVDEFKTLLGLNVMLKNSTFGYAFIPGMYFEPSHRLTVSYRFGS